MSEKPTSGVRLSRLAGTFAGLAVAGVLLAPGNAAAEPRAITPPTIPGVPTLAGPIAAPAQPSPKGLTLLKSTPDTGKVGTKFTLSGTGLPEKTPVQIVWGTQRGSYLLDVQPVNVDYGGRKFEQISIVLAQATTDANGALSVELTAPEDYGETHDLYVVSKAVQLAKGGFRILRSYSVTPAEGVVGRSITVKVTGLGAHPYLSTVAIIYDNKYSGFISATTTRGTAVAQIRAAGPVGVHTIEVAPASAAVPYLDIEQSAIAFVGKYRTTFKVTKDAGPPRNSIEFPAKAAPTVASRVTLTVGMSAGVTANLSSSSGPNRSKLQLTASGLVPSAPADLQWLTTQGSRVNGLGWALDGWPLGRATTGPDGSLNTPITVPEDLGGWHTVRITQAGQVKAEVPYYVEQRLAGVTVRKVKAGQEFTVHLKGIGWTELDNALAVTYDNAYIGYACGFYSQGDIQMNLVASGGPGTHLIDLYPMVYKSGPMNDVWLRSTPMLSFGQDAPGLGLGYRIPAYHLAIQIVK
jgi:hypothetical protein